jgi:hypothetical protein
MLTRMSSCAQMHFSLHGGCHRASVEVSTELDLAGQTRVWIKGNGE